jgi:uncharacterized protein involved in exopolysaccharide biosynthesis
MTIPKAQMPGSRPIGWQAGDEGAEEGALLGIVAAILRHWRMVLLFAVAVPLLLVLPALFEPRVYEVRASFMPQSRRSPANISGLAAQLGLNFPQSEGGQSPQFYMELLNSSEMLRTTVTAPLEGGSGDSRGAGTTLVDRERARDPDASEALLIHRAIERLDERLSVSISARTGIVSLGVRDEDPARAREIVGKLLDEVNRFNLDTRKSSAAEERRFTEERFAQASRDLRMAEERRQQFISQNRGFQSSSRLMLEQDRLTREVANAEQVYSMLLTAYEQAKIDEVRDTPVITVIEPPREPAAPLSRGLAIRLLIGLIVGLTLGFLVALARSRIGAMRAAGAPGWMELESVLPRRRRL